jgi:hypothetical protein
VFVFISDNVITVAEIFASNRCSEQRALANNDILNMTPNKMSFGVTFGETGG